MTDCIIRLNIEESKWDNDIPDLSALVNKIKNTVINYLIEKEKSVLLTTKKTVVIDVCLSNDMHVHSLNRQFRNIDKSTNVLSFANIDFADFEIEKSLYPEIELGDIIIAYETMKREAEEQEISLHDHFCHLLTHGILHLCGYDHIKPQEATYMEHIETDILHELQIANPYE